MIPERFMATGKDIKTGETICGFPVRRKSRFSELESMLIEDKYGTTRIVDPESIEPLAVSPAREDGCKNTHCPNCGSDVDIQCDRCNQNAIDCEDYYEYCMFCGQRLEWEEKE